MEFQRYLLDENNARSIHPKDKQKKEEFQRIVDEIKSEGERYLGIIRKIDRKMYGSTEDKNETEKPLMSYTTELILVGIGALCVLVLLAYFGSNL